MAKSPGRKRDEQAADSHEEQYRETLRRRGGAPLGRAKEYNFSDDPVVPLDDERHVRRDLDRLTEHRAAHQPAGGDPAPKMPFGNLRSGKG